MKFLIIAIFAIIIAITPSFAYAENTLQNTSLTGESAVITLDIKFGEDTVRTGIARDWITNHLNQITLTFYGDEIRLSEPELRVTSSGDHFRIHSVPEEILMYGHKNLDLENYKINIYFATDDGLNKFSVYTSAPLADEYTETEPIEVETQYVPDICFISSHDFKTYWQQNFNIDVQTFDCNVNSDPESFNDFYGRYDDVDVKVLLTLDDEEVGTLSGVTVNNGQWAGEWYFPANISPPGEYVVDVIVTYLDQTLTKTTSMFVINQVLTNDSTNHPPVANAGIDQSEDEHDGVIPTYTEITLDGSTSSDPDGNTITYLWVQTSGTSVPLSDNTAQQPTFPAPDITVTEDLIFELTVTDSKGLQSLIADSVTITVIFLD